MTLEEFFRLYPSGALAFSGGTDSSFLLWAAKHYGAQYMAYYVRTAFQPAFELADARRLAAELSSQLTVIEAEVMSRADVIANRADRCYRCKSFIFSNIMERAKADGYATIIDGTNASDDAGDRPGMKALKEAGVLSPLRECGITKPEVRRASHDAGLFTWDKPSYSCLATRITTGVQIRAEDLKRVEGAENELFSLGFSDFRVRANGDSALLQCTERDMARYQDKQDEIIKKLRLFFRDAALDPKPRAEERR